MKTVLLNPPNPPNRVSNKEMMGGFGQCYPLDCKVKVPPIDIPYAAAVLRKESIDCQIIDCLGLNYSLDDLLDKLSVDPSTLIFIRTSTPTIAWDLKVARAIKEKTESQIILFGPQLTISPEETLANHFVDAVIVGEPELIIRDAVKDGFEGTAGLWYKKNGKEIRNQPSDFIQDLDALPFPAWDLMPYKEYTIGSLLPDRGTTLFMLTSRGCPFKCGYCPYIVAQGTQYRTRTAHNVIQELQHLVLNFKVQNLLIRDAEFTLDKKRTVDICNGIINAGIKIKWRCETRLDTLDEELLELMSRAGCAGVNFGIESSDRAILEKIGRKPIEEKLSVNLVRKCKELGIETFVFFILGLPGDDEKSIINTMEYAIALNADVSQFTVATPYPGTKLHEWASARNYMEGFNPENITGFDEIMRNEVLTSAQIYRLRNLVQQTVDAVKQKEKPPEPVSLDRGNRLISHFLNNLISFIMSGYFYLYYLLGTKKIVVYGTQKISIHLLKKMGFLIINIISNGKEVGEIVDKKIVLPDGFIEFIECERLLVSPHKITSDIANLPPEIKVIGDFRILKKWFRTIKNSGKNYLQHNFCNERHSNV